MTFKCIESKWHNIARYIDEGHLKDGQIVCQGADLTLSTEICEQGAVGTDFENRQAPSVEEMRISYDASLPIETCFVDTNLFQDFDDKSDWMDQWENGRFTKNFYGREAWLADAGVPPDGPCYEKSLYVCDCPCDMVR
jgi:hypothetical protein